MKQHPIPTHPVTTIYSQKSLRALGTLLYISLCVYVYALYSCTESPDGGTTRHALRRPLLPLFKYPPLDTI